jgi:2-C-methyl-D-erythritol 4-phosphate cytidylyltransferase
MRLGVIIAAGGIGSRMGLGESKQLYRLAGKPVIAHSLAVFEQSDAVNDIVVAIDAAAMERLHAEVIDEYGLRKVSKVVAGGGNRAESVRAGLRELDKEDDTVLVHDGARPLFSASLLQSGLKEYSDSSCDGIVFGLPVTDTIKETGVDSGLVIRTPDREGLWQAQTPQLFNRGMIEKAYGVAPGVLAGATDDSALVERAGGRVKMVRGSRENIKLTEPADIVLAEAILRSRAARVED